jgi:type II secretory pathway pseudopilin PulG
MNCRPKKKNQSAAFTIFEVLVAMGISSVLFSAVASMMLFGGKSSAALGNYADLDRMTTDIRQADRLTSYSTNQLQFVTTDPTNGVTTLTFAYNATAGTLNRIYLSKTNTLLTGIVSNSLQFSMYQRNPIGGTVDQEATTNASVCKVVQLTWICSRSILGRKANTESVQSAKVVIRKK